MAQPECSGIHTDADSGANICEESLGSSPDPANTGAYNHLKNLEKVHF